MATVKELINRLSEFDPELEVITAKDEEGNGYNDVYIPYVGPQFFDGEDLEWAIAQEDVDEMDPEDRDRIRTIVVI